MLSRAVAALSLAVAALSRQADLSAPQNWTLVLASQECSRAYPECALVYLERALAVGNGVSE